MDNKEEIECRHIFPDCANRRESKNPTCPIKQWPTEFDIEHMRRFAEIQRFILTPGALTGLMRFASDPDKDESKGE